MLRLFTAVVANTRMAFGGASRLPKIARTQNSRLLDDAQYMSADSKRLVQSSLEAWDSLPEPDRQVPTQL